MLVFGVPLTNHRVIFERRAGKAVKMHLVDTHDVSRFAKRFLDVTVFEDASPNTICSGLLVKQDGVFQGFFAVNYYLQ